MPASRTDFRSEVKLREKLTVGQTRGLVVSSEHFLGEMFGFYSDAVEKVKWLTENFHSIKLIVYLRPHTEWHESAFSQLIQQGTEVTEKAYIEGVRRSPVGDLRGLARLISNVNMFDSIGWVRHAADVVEDFSTLLGYKLPRVKRANVSLHPLALEAFPRLKGERGFSRSDLRQNLAFWKPETSRAFSIFSQETQTLLLSKNSEWLEVADLISAFQEVPPGWTQAFPVGTKPSAKEHLTEQHIVSMREHMKSARRGMAN